MPPDAHATTEGTFAAALWHDGPPPGLVGTDTDRRFAVYRNNVQHGLSQALSARFPVVERLVGADFFAALARAFLRAAPPTDPVLLRWGDAFPGFLATFPPVAHLPYLPDIARLEWLRGRAYHAADADPIDPARLAAADPAALCLTLHPSVAILSSPWAVLSIWAANQPGQSPAHIDATRPEQALIARTPAFDIITAPLDPASARILAALAAGQPLGRSAATDDPTPALTLLLRHGLITAIATIGPTP
jgi:hypothetical protein